MRATTILAALAMTTVSSSATPPPIIHRYDFAYPVCITIPDKADDRSTRSEDDGGWFRPPPCMASDIGWIDENRVAHFQGDRACLKFALVKMLREFYGLPIKAAGPAGSRLP